MTNIKLKEINKSIGEGKGGTNYGLHKKGLWFDEKDDDDETNVQEEVVSYYTWELNPPSAGPASLYEVTKAVPVWKSEGC